MRYLLLLAAVAVGATASSAARALDNSTARTQRLELPGAPVAVFTADLDADGIRDLLTVVAVVGWGENATSKMLAMDEVEGLVEVMTVVPALVDRREVHAFLGGPEGFRPFGAPLVLPPWVVTVEQGGAIAPALAIGGDGVAAVRFDQGALVLVPLLPGPTDLAGVDSLVPELGLVVDVDGDGVVDVLVPRGDGLAIHRGGPGVLSAEPAAVLRGFGAQHSSAARVVRRLPLPEVGDLDGDKIPDLLFRDPLEDWELVRIARGLGQGRFEAPREVAFASSEEGGEPILVADLDGDGKGELVFQIEGEEREGLRASLREAREPESVLEIRSLEAGGAGAVRTRLDVTGFVFGDRNLPLPGGFTDLDGDGRRDLAALTTDLGITKAMGALATKRITVEIGVNLWCGEAAGWRRVVPLDLSGPLRVDLSDVRVRRLAFFAGDFDGDGRRDYLEIGKDNTARIRRGQAGCRYPSKSDLEIVMLAAPADPLLARVLDLDGDGTDDLAVIQPARAQEPGLPPTVGLELAWGGR